MKDFSYDRKLFQQRLSECTRGRTQKEVAKILGVSESKVSRWMNPSDTSDIPVSDIINISKRFFIPVGYLLGFESVNTGALGHLINCIEALQNKLGERMTFIMAEENTPNRSIKITISNCGNDKSKESLYADALIEYYSNLDMLENVPLSADLRKATVKSWVDELQSRIEGEA